jgi:hypothetical protein
MIHYDPDTGEFTWLQPLSNRVRPGDHPSNVSAQGYVRVGVGGRVYLAHRLAWFYVHGYWPAEEVDHINGCRTDNRICNLREANRRLNSQNMKKHRAGKLPGSSFYQDIGKWRSTIYYGGVHHLVGYYPTEEEAHEAYMKACKEYL